MEVFAVFACKKDLSAVIDVLSFDLFDALDRFPCMNSLAGHSTPFNDNFHMWKVINNLSELYFVHVSEV